MVDCEFLAVVILKPRMRLGRREHGVLAVEHDVERRLP